MHRKIATLVALALLTPVIGFSQDKPGLYVSAGGALVVPQDSKIKNDRLGSGLSGKFGFEAGYGLTLAGGYAFGNGLRTEIELGYRSYDLEDLTIDPITYTYTDPDSGEQTFTLANSLKIGARGTASKLSVMVNGLYVFQELGFPILPYAGAGIGVVRHKVSEWSSPDLPGYRFSGGTANTFGYQLMLGVKYPIEALELGLGYRLTSSSKAEFGTSEVSYLAHNLDLGVTLRF